MVVCFGYVLLVMSNRDPRNSDFMSVFTMDFGIYLRINFVFVLSRHEQYPAHRSNGILSQLTLLPPQMLT